MTGHFRKTRKLAGVIIACSKNERERTSFSLRCALLRAILQYGSNSGESAERQAATGLVTHVLLLLALCLVRERMSVYRLFSFLPTDSTFLVSPSITYQPGKGGGELHKGT